MLFPILGSSSLPDVVALPDERHANRTASMLEWYDMTDTKHSITSGSNEEEELLSFIFSYTLKWTQPSF